MDLIVNFGWLVVLLLGVLFSIFYGKNRTSLYNGIFFNILLLAIIIYTALIVIKINNNILITISISIVVAGLLAIILVYSMMAFLLLWNAFIVWKREEHSLANSLTLILGLAILIVPIIMKFSNEHFPTMLSEIIYTYPTLLTLYFAFWFYNFLTVVILYQISILKHNKDFIIVLGAGLLEGKKVTPLLAQRIDKGIEFYQKQKRRNNKTAKLIFSGGQGPDEKISEGQAMQNYALSQGINIEDTIVEDKSKTTYENMLFSKKIIDSFNYKKPKVIFVSNNYHIFRAARYAKLAKLDAVGIGSKTSKFFLPNAIIREYIAVLVCQQRLHIIVCVFLLVVTILLSLINADPGLVYEFFKKIRAIFNQ